MTLYPYASTHRLERTPGGHLRKDLSSAGRLAAARAHTIRPRVLENPGREPAMYRMVLGPMGIGPRMISSGGDWVVLEKVEGVELWQVGDPEVWVEVAGWLAGLHADLGRAGFDGVPLAEYSPTFFDNELERASAASGSVRAAYRAARRVLAAEPIGILHGDMYPSNVLVGTAPGFRVVPVDWELAGRGPAVLDLAALVSGGWSGEVRDRMAAAYFGRVGCPRRDDWQPRLDAAMLQVCLRWLGAPGEWEAPFVHRHDWLGEAEELAARLLAGPRG